MRLSEEIGNPNVIVEHLDSKRAFIEFPVWDIIRVKNREAIEAISSI